MGALVDVIVDITWFIITISVILCLLAVVLFGSWYVYWRYIKGIKPKTGQYKYVSHGWKVKRLLWDFPKQLMLDYLEKDPDYFREYGVHVVEGDQGKGKTIATVYMLRRFQQMYPKLKVKTNFNFKNQDDSIKSHNCIIASENGIYGEIDVIDEIQNWFNSLNSKNFPPEMMTEITQQRKQRKMIMGTSQVFTRVAKPIREQTYFLYTPLTIGGCLTFVLISKPVISADNAIPDKKKYCGMFFFVHDKELRESYDTYHKIEQMAKEGYKETDKQVR
jgi:hypothetical protein